MIGAQQDAYVVLTGDLKSKEVLNWKWFEMDIELKTVNRMW